MIHNAECHIVIDPVKMGMGSAIEPPIPSNVEMEEVFPDWKDKRYLFVARCCKEEGRELDTLTTQDIFRYGMKFVICEAKKLI